MQVDNPQETVEAIKHGEIDESLYSRQLYECSRWIWPREHRH